MTDTTLASDDTETSENNSQGTTKTFTQEEVNAMMATQKTNITRKVKSKYENLGTIDELTALKTAAEEATQQEQIDKGQFEETLKDMATKKDNEISKRDMIIRSYKINTPLLDAAAQHRSINPEQVKLLLANSVTMNDDGEVEVIDSKSKVRYADNGSLFTVDALVGEFLDSNPHFVQPTKSTTHTKSNINDDVGEVNINDLDMTNPAHRAVYAKYRKKRGMN